MVPHQLGCLVEAPPTDCWEFPARAARTGPRAILRIVTPTPDQLSLGSCVGQSIKRALEILDGRGALLSAYGAYLDGTIASGFAPEQDAGCYPEAAVRAMVKGGIGSASLAPYDVESWPEQTSAAYKDQSRDHRVLSWFRARQVEQAKAALEAGYPVLVAFEVPPGFSKNVGAQGLWSDPGGAAEGGHMVVLYGYDNAKIGGAGYGPGCFYAINSWGPWGGPVEEHAHLTGGFRIPFEAFAPGGRFYDALVISRWDAKAGEPEPEAPQVPSSSESSPDSETTTSKPAKPRTVKRKAAKRRTKKAAKKRSS